MKVLLALLLAICGPLLAAGPQLLVRGARGEDAPLDIDEIAIEVTVAGDVAETTILVGFRNMTSRRLEGDFVMPLPEGATVSSYALDVLGHMRPGVAVEKERARFAYESIKRQMIDPGFVEREAGNVYRTKIFPILPNAVKRVQLGYVEPLKTVDSKLLYTLPCQFDVPVAKFSCRIRGTGGTQLKLTETIGLMFTETPSGVLSAKSANQAINGTLSLAVSPPKNPTLLVEDAGDGEDRFFALTDLAPDQATVPPRRQPDRILLVWDASESRQLHASELATLDAWFQQIRNTEVRLQILRNTLVNAGSFAVRDGQWKTLRKVLENTCYDGATALDQLRLDDIREDLVILCSDGISPLGLPAGKPAQPLCILNGSPAPTPRPWTALARRSGGTAIDLAHVDPATAARLLTKHTLQVVSVAGIGVHTCYFDSDLRPGQAVRISGRLRPDAAGMFQVNYGYGETVLETRSFTIESGQAADGGIIRRTWAQAALRDLESAPTPDKDRIIAHCRSYGLVSDHTSLIVLERFEDHVRYEIPPPEDHLLVRYNSAIADQRTARTKGGFDQLGAHWDQKRQWHKLKFPWMEIALLPRLKQVSIWSRAVSTVFRDEDLDQKAFRVIDDWRREALKVVRRRDDLATKEDLDQWEREIGALVASGAKLRATPIQSPTGDTPLVVSVRGLVNKPGNISGEPGMTLKQAITKAGDIHALGGNTNVEVYRNAGKTVYNMASIHFEDVPLKPGDMVVVGPPDDPDDDWGDIDPFAPHDTSTRRNPSQEPAIVEDSDVWVRGSGGAGDDDPFGDSSGGAPPFRSDISDDAEETSKLVSSIRVHRADADAPAAFQEFENALKKKENPHTAYRTLRPGGPQPPAFYVHAARILATHGHHELAVQVLSNFRETPEPDLGRFLTNIMWLAEIKRTTEAVTLLDDTRRMMPEDVLATYLRAMIDTRRDRHQAVAADLLRVIEHGGPDRAIIALTDFNGLTARDKITRPASFPPHLRENFDADIRIVVVSSDPDHGSGLTVSEPNGSVCRYSSPCGGRLARANGISEYMIRRAMPGRYTVNCRTGSAMTARAIIYRHWGRPNQSAESVTLLLPGESTSTTIAELDFAFDQ